MNKPELKVSNEIKIEKGVPILGNRTHKYPLAEMEVGDSILMPETTNASAFRSTIDNFRARSAPDRKYRVLKVAEGYRCWRIA